MRFKKFKVSCIFSCLLLSAMATSLLHAQGRQSSAPMPLADHESAVHIDNPTAPRLLTADEGLTILAAALESRHHVNSRLDCSHLVHAIYERAGFPYSYVSSTDLYVGIAEFRRVTRPQPGDLVVWRGHIGIEINPVEHSFFSALRSGLGVESYESPYWKRRVRPRFFRYVKGPTPSLPSGSVEAASLQPSGLGNAGSHRSRTTALKGSAADAPEVSASEMQPASVPIPRVRVINSARPRPDQVRNALVQTIMETDQALNGRDLFVLSESMIVFDTFEIGKVHLTGDRGRVEIWLRGSSSLTGGRVKQRKRLEQERWILTRRDAESWELILPRETAYLSRNIAARILAHQLAALTDARSESAADHEKQFQLAHLLNAILTPDSEHHHTSVVADSW
jgi:hypothetical protein